MQFALLRFRLSRGMRIRSLTLLFPPKVSELFTYDKPIPLSAVKMACASFRVSCKNADGTLPQTNRSSQRLRPSLRFEALDHSSPQSGLLFFAAETYRCGLQWLLLLRRSCDRFAATMTHNWQTPDRSRPSRRPLRCRSVRDSGLTWRAHHHDLLHHWRMPMKVEPGIHERFPIRRLLVS